MTDSIASVEAVIAVDGAELSGTLATPPGPPAPGVLLLGGTFSDLRDGDADPGHRPDIPPHGMYRVLADALAAAGFAVLRFDRRGCGASSGDRPDRAQEISDALEAWGWLDRHEAVSGAWAMVGESAGAYVACRLMAAAATPRAVVLQGALHRSIAGLIDFNAQRARRYWERGEAARDWMWHHARSEYESAVIGAELLSAMLDGRSEVAVVDARGTFTRTLDGLDYDLRFAPAEQFRFVSCPTLVLHGGDDLNVPTEDAFATARELWAAGNRDVEVTILARADHSMQATPPDEDERLRERMSFASFRRPFHARYPGVVVDFLSRQADRTSRAGDIPVPS